MHSSGRFLKLLFTLVGLCSANSRSRTICCPRWRRWSISGGLFTLSRMLYCTVSKANDILVPVLPPSTMDMRFSLWPEERDFSKGGWALSRCTVSTPSHRNEPVKTVVGIWLECPPSAWGSSGISCWKEHSVFWQTQDLLKRLNIYVLPQKSWGRWGWVPLLRLVWPCYLDLENGCSRKRMNATLDHREYLCPSRAIVPLLVLLTLYPRLRVTYSSWCWFIMNFGLDFC